MTFRSALLASAAILTAGSAFAADLPARVAPAPYIAAPIFTWTGFYVGLNAGGAWDNSNNNGVGFSGFPAGIVASNTFFGGNRNNNGGFTGGVQAGYNWQFGPSFVAGVEGDLNYVDRGNGNSGFIPNAFAVPAAAGTVFAINHGGSNNFFGTARVRLGFAVDRALIYATGGLAFGGNNGGGSIVQYNVPAGGPLPVGTVLVNGNGNNNNNIGWALGAGVEYAFSNAWSLKLEYLHVDLGSNSRTFTTVAGVGAAPIAAGSFITVHDDNKFDLVRVGVNYRF